MRVEKNQNSKNDKPIEIEKEGGKKEVVEKPFVKEYQSRIPYPSGLKQNKIDDQFKWFLELFE